MTNVEFTTSDGVIWLEPLKDLDGKLKIVGHEQALEIAYNAGFRLPSKEEIESAIKEGFLKNSEWFWPSTEYPENNKMVYVYDGYEGKIEFDYKYFDFYITTRLVRNNV